MNKRMLLFLLVFCLCFCTACGKKKDKKYNLTTAVTTEEYVAPEPVTTEAPKPEVDEQGFVVTDDYVIVTADIANARVSANDTADIFRMVPTDTIMPRTGYNDTWTRVIIESTPFYVSSATVAVTDKRPEDEEDEEGEEEEDEEDDGEVKVVVIDPCKQDTLNVSTDQLGPGSDETKQAVTTGAVSIGGTKESEVNLSIATMLKTELEARGYQVILTRDNDKLDISNKARAQVANNANADIFVRIQLAESSDYNVKGILGFCPSVGNPYNGHLYDDSYQLTTRLLQGIIEQTETVNHGIIETDQMTAMNWSEMPVATISVGYLTNYEDEMHLLDKEYKNKIVAGLANGIDYYFKK